jgi:hypothetical protein
MTRIQLEDFGYIDVLEETTFPINFTVQDVLEIDKTNSSYSKNITIVGSKETNLLLGQLFDINVSDSSFNVNKKVRCNVLQNDVNIFDNAYFQLLKVIRNQESSENSVNGILYIGVVKESISTFFGDIKEKELRDLNLGDDSTFHYLSRQNVIDSFSHDVDDKYKYTIVSNGNAPTNLRVQHFRPSIYAKYYWDLIHQTNGWEYEFGEEEDVLFDRLLVQSGEEYEPSENTRELSEVIAEDGTFYSYNFGDFSSFNPATNFPNINVTNPAGLPNLFLDAGSIVKDEFNQQSVTGDRRLVAAFTCDYDIDLSFDLDLIVDNFDAANVVVQGNSQDALTLDFEIVVQRFSPGNLFLGQVVDSGFQYTIPVGTQFVPGQNIVSSGVVNFNTTISMSSGFNYRIIIRMVRSSNNTIQFRSVPNPNQLRALGFLWGVNNTSYKASPQLEYNAGLPIFLNDFVPRQIKQRDFIKSIIDVYNLVSFIDPNQENKIIYQTRDKFYDDGIEKDWTHKLDKSKPDSKEWVQEKQGKSYLLTYAEDDNDVVNRVYKSQTKKIFGQYEHIYENDYNQGQNKKELIFGPALIAYDSNKNIYYPSLVIGDENLRPKLLLDNGVRSDAYYFFESDDGLSSVLMSDYPLAHTWDDPTNPSFDLNFGVADYYLYRDYNISYNNLFTLFHQRQVSQLTDGRIYTAYFDLNETDILNLKLNDKIWVNDCLYNINKIIDYDANLKRTTKVELITADSEIERAFTPPPRRPSKPFPGEDVIRVPFDRVRKGNSTITNSFGGSNSDVNVGGDNNTIAREVKNTTVAGSRNSVGDDSIIYGDDNSIGAKSMIIGNESYSESRAIIIGDGVSAPLEGFFLKETQIKNDEIRIGDTVIRNDKQIGISTQYVHGGYVDDEYALDAEGYIGWSFDDATGEVFFDLAVDEATISAPIIKMTNLPTSSSGLPAGALWRDGNDLKIV